MKLNTKRFLIENNTYFIFLFLFVICCVASDSFLSVMNLRNIALQQAAPICVVLGMLMVIKTGGIDLSVGSVMALGSAVTAVLITDHGVHFIPAMGLSLLIGLLCGLFCGVLVAYFNFQGFVASLVTMTSARGLALVITNGQPIKIDKATLATLVNKEYGYPILIIALVLILLFVFVEKYTSYGRIIMAIGSNRQAVDLSGIRSQVYLASVYAVSGMMAALAGVFVAARASTGNGTIGSGQELDAIAACVIGGASLAGGKGEVFKAVIGALVLALIGNIMNLMAVPAYPQDIIKGGIIAVAVMLQLMTNKTNK